MDTPKPINTGGPAFPTAQTNGAGAKWTDEGMTLRDWFAGQALPAIYATDDVIVSLGEGGRRTTRDATATDIARFAYQLADAMLAARGNTP